MITESTDILHAKRAEKLRPRKQLSYRVVKKVNLIHSLCERNERKKIDKGSPNENPRYNPTRRIHYNTSAGNPGHTEKTTYVIPYFEYFFSLMAGLGQDSYEIKE